MNPAAVGLLHATDDGPSRLGGRDGGGAEGEGDGEEEGLHRRFDGMDE